MMLRNEVIILFIIILLFPVSSFAETVTVYTYHDHPPFITDRGEGLTYELIQLLSEQSGDVYSFDLRIIPRTRLNLILKDWIAGKCLSSAMKCDDNWAVIWVNQHWGFGQNPMKNYFWIPMLEDSNSVISLTSNKIEYKDPRSLSGMLLGGMMGHKYVGIDDLIQKGLIKRIDGTEERDNIFKLIKKRVDVILLPTSAIRYFISRDKIVSQYAGELYIAPIKHQTYTRNFMVPKIRDDIATFFESIDFSSVNWKRKLRDVGLE